MDYLNDNGKVSPYPALCRRTGRLLLSQMQSIKLVSGCYLSNANNDELNITNVLRYTNAIFLNLMFLHGRQLLTLSTNFFMIGVTFCTIKILLVLIVISLFFFYYSIIQPSFAKFNDKAEIRLCLICKCRCTRSLKLNIFFKDLQYV